MVGTRGNCRSQHGLVLSVGQAWMCLLGASSNTAGVLGGAVTPDAHGSCCQGLTDSETQILLRNGQFPIFLHPEPKPQSLTVNWKHQCHAGREAIG